MCAIFRSGFCVGNILSNEVHTLNAGHKRYLNLLSYDALLYTDYACSGGYAALSDYQPLTAFEPLQKGLREIMAGNSLVEAEAHCCARPEL